MDKTDNRLIKNDNMCNMSWEEVQLDLLKRFAIDSELVNENNADDWKLYNDNYAGIYFDERDGIVICTVGIDMLDVSKYNKRITHKKCKYSYRYLYKIRNMILPKMNYNGVCDLNVNIKENIIEVGVRDNDMADSNIEKLIECLKSECHYHENAVKIRITNYIDKWV